jgi:PKD repeat protein
MAQGTDATTHLGCVFLVLLVAALVASAGAPVAAQGCPDDGICGYSPCRAPAVGVPQELWGDLRPVDVGALPNNRDSTDYDVFQDQNDLVTGKSAQWIAVDIEDGWIFTGVTMGFEIWDGRGAKAAQPLRVKQVIGSFNPSPFPVWAGDSHETQVVRDIDAPPGNSNVVAMAIASAAGGLAVFDTTSKVFPEGLYGDRDKFGRQVWAGRVGGREYAFLATESSGLLVYDLTSAAALGSKCVDTSPALILCGDVYEGRLGERFIVNFVDGAGNADGTRLFVAASGLVPRGVEIWDVSSPDSPSLEIVDLTTILVQGVALWRRGTSYYLAVRALASPQARIYDVSCLESGDCNGLGSPIWTGTMSPASDEYLVTHSQAEGRDFLYFGATGRCAGGERGEWLYDVTDPASPRELTPPPGLVNGEPTAYWGWYYRVNPTGFNNVGPRAGKVYGSHLYRAAFGIFDIHEIVVPSPPAADFSYAPNPAWAGDSVSFTDLSSRLPLAWDWLFDGATPASSTTQNPTVTFATPGEKTVTLQAENDVGWSAPIARTVTVLDPSPAIGGVTVTPAEPLLCQPVTLRATDAIGRPPLTLAWEVRDDGGSPIAGGAGASYVWRTEGAVPGDYDAELEVDNADGPPATAETAITLADLPSLPENGSFAPTSELLVEGSVRFSVTAPGATAFCWDFGDGAQYPAGCLTKPSRWSIDPERGPNPTHVYSGLGTYPVTVLVRNCIDTTPRASAVHEVEILSAEPLVAGFQVNGGLCFGGACLAEAGELVQFSDSTSGAPSLYEYDWDGDGTFEQSASAPVTTHAFDRAGQFTPVLRVHRGSETDTSALAQELWINGLFDDGFETGDLSRWSTTTP